MTKSRILEAVHETAMDMFEAGVMNQVTMREFDILCLPKPCANLTYCVYQKLKNSNHKK